MKIVINWDKIIEESAKEYGDFVSSYAETWREESKIALEKVYKRLIELGFEVDKPKFVKEWEEALAWGQRVVAAAKKEGRL